MFTHRKTNGTNERGALMMEAIALLGLMTMMSPMIVRQTADHHSETEEVGMANQIKELKTALGAWIAANYQNELKTASGITKKEVPAAQLAPYLSPGFLERDAEGVYHVRGHKLADSYKTGVRIECKEEDEHGKCVQAQITGLVLSDGPEEIDARRAAKIASMIGADGGYMLSGKMVDALDAESEKSKIFGTQGVWEGNVNDYFDGDISGGRVAATTVYSGSFSGDFLYRKKVDGMPDANSMFTDLDMGTHSIKSAGGMEIVNGVIRIRNSAGGADKIRLSKDEVMTDVTGISMNASDTLAMNVGSVGVTLNSATGVNLKGNGSNLKINNTIQANAGSSVFFHALSVAGSSGAATLSGSGGGLALYPGAINIDVSTGSALFNISSYAGGLLQASNNVSLNLNDSTATLKADNFRFSSTANPNQLNKSGDQMTFGNTSSFYMKFLSNSASMGKNSGNEVRVSSGRVNVNGGNVGKVSIADGSISYRSGADMELDLNEDTVSFVREKYVVNAKQELAFKNDAMTIASNAQYASTPYGPRISFNSAGVNISVFSNQNSVRLANNLASEANAPIAFYANTGQISGSYFEPETVMKNGAGWVNPVRSRVRLGFADEDTGKTKIETNSTGFNVSISSSLNEKDATVGIDCSARGTGPTPYCLHKKDSNYNRYRVDPAFVSVMNDIKQTSRGGARLSEALPNYILKGIYVLTNSYTAGPWPCSSDGNTNNCIFNMPRYSKTQLGLSSGGYEFNCAGGSDHPMKGSCSMNGSDGNGYVTFNYYQADKYKTCGNGEYCWAHPFMGKVPAPGYKVTTKTSDKDEVLYAHAEGVCPDGYQAVLTLTPNSFEMGRVLSYNPDAKVIGAKVKYNFNLTNFDNSQLRDATNMIQLSTRIGIASERITSDGDNGWRIAMGTVTPAASPRLYVWNFGGIPANSWTVLAHTYCYFNPNRFIMPNMRFKKMDPDNDNEEVILTPLERRADEMID